MGLNKEISKLIINSVIILLAVILGLLIIQNLPLKNILLAGFIIETLITIFRIFAFRTKFRIGFSYIFWILTQTILYYLTMGTTMILQTIWITIVSIILSYIRLDKILLRSFNEMGYVRTNHPPKWVVKQVSKIKWTGANQYIKLKGNHYKYKVLCVGQGQFDFYKKKR